MPSQDPFEVRTQYENEEAHLTLTGKLDQSTFAIFQSEMEDVLTKKPKRLVLMLENLDSMANVGIRVLLFARQRMDIWIEPTSTRSRQTPKSARRSCGPIPTRRTSTSSRATTHSVTPTPRRTRARWRNAPAGLLAPAKLSIIQSRFSARQSLQRRRS